MTWDQDFRRAHQPTIERPLRRVRSDDAQATLELCIVAPLLVVVMLLMVSIGRIYSAQGDVEAAARAGVQAAVVADNAATAENDANTAAANTLSSAGLACPTPLISTNTSNFTAGGTVSVTVKCVTSLGNVSVPGLPGTKILVASASAEIDPFRAVAGAGS